MKLRHRHLSRHKVYTIQAHSPNQDRFFDTFDCIDQEKAMEALDLTKKVPGSFRIVETITTRRVVWPEGCEMTCTRPHGHDGDCLPRPEVE